MHISDPHPKAILLTGGVGDIFCLESHFDILDTLETVYWATRSYRLMLPLFEQVYPHLKHVNVVDNEIWDELWAFMGGWDVCAKLPRYDPTKQRWRLTEMLEGVDDWGVAVKFSQLTKSYKGSVFLRHRLADIAKFDLPERYAVLQPYTPLNRNRQRTMREYRPRDWERTEAWLKERNLPAVVLNVGGDKVPEPYIDLSNRTTLGEAVEVLKHASAYIGIDSCFACLAAQLFPNGMMQVMWRNTQYYEERYRYLAPKKDFDFLVHG